MAYDLGQYSKFDPTQNCQTCSQDYCINYGFAAYDNDGDLMQLITSLGDDGKLPGTKWYKKANTLDTVAVLPYHYLAAPCCYSMTLNNFQNHTVDKSWCASCTNLNGTYYDTTYRGYFGLCSINKPYMPCTMYAMIFSVSLASGIDSNIDIVARCSLLADRGLTYSNSDDQNYRAIGVGYWSKILGQYDGDYRGTQISPQPPTPYTGDYGTFDGRNLTVDFDYSNFTVETDELGQYVGDLCDFSSATIHIEPRASHQLYRICRDQSTIIDMGGYSDIATTLCTQTHFPRSCFDRSTAIEQLFEPAYVSLIPSKAVLTLSGVISPDDLIPIENLEKHHCQKCTNLNRTYNLIKGYNSNVWEFGYSSYTNVQSDTPISTCCECEGVSTCITNIKFMLDISTDTIHTPGFYNLDAVLNIYNYDNILSEGIVVATFRQRLLELVTSENLKVLDCGNLHLNNMEYTGGIAPSGIYRCDFSNAVATIDFASYEDTQITCRYSTSSNRCDDSQNIKVSFPENQWVWNGDYICMNPYTYEMLYITGCSGVQPLSGDYIIENCNRYYEENLPSNLGGCNDSVQCPGCSRVDFSLNVGVASDGSNASVELTATIDGWCCEFNWRGVIPAYNGLNYIRSKHYPYELEPYYGPYYNCDDLNGLELTYQGASCPGDQTPPIDPERWTYLGGPVRLELI